MIRGLDRATILSRWAATWGGRMGVDSGKHDAREPARNGPFEGSTGCRGRARADGSTSHMGVAANGSRLVDRCQPAGRDRDRIRHRTPHPRPSRRPAVPRPDAARWQRPAAGRHVPAGHRPGRPRPALGVAVRRPSDAPGGHRGQCGGARPGDARRPRRGLRPCRAARDWWAGDASSSRSRTC